MQLKMFFRLPKVYLINIKLSYDSAVFVILLIDIRIFTFFFYSPNIILVMLLCQILLHYLLQDIRKYWILVNIQKYSTDILS